MSRPYLEDLERSFLRESNRLHSVFVLGLSDCVGCASGALCGSQHALVELCVIRLHDAWHRFSRRVAVASASGGITKSGTRLPKCPGIRSIQGVVPRLRSIDGAPPSWREPAWHVSAELSAASVKLGLPNLLQIQAGVGFVGSPEPDLRRLRNFYAHHRPNLNAKVLELCDDLAIPRTTPPNEIPALAPAGQPLFEEWLNTLQYMAGIMVQ